MAKSSRSKSPGRGKTAKTLKNAAQIPAVSLNERPRKLVDWTVNDVSSWLLDLKFPGPVVRHLSLHGVDGEILGSLSERDLRDPPLAIPLLGDLFRLWQAISTLQQVGDTTRLSHPLTRMADVASQYQFSAALGKYLHRWRGFESTLDALARLLVALVLFAASILLTVFTLALVSIRVPDQRIYPPLPDVVLDNVPVMPWAFSACEYILVLLAMIFLGILIGHKHRLVILRRFLAIISTLYFFRCVTMYATSLSVPESGINCDRFKQISPELQFAHAWSIATSAGLSIAGVQSCGDYMFSGHTLSLYLLNLFICEYTSGMKALHIFSHVCFYFGAFFVLASHQHYTIDVLIAWYITQRLFVYYHTLAALPRPKGMTWMEPNVFPFFYYLEEKSEGVVPNVFSWPWSRR